MSRIICTRCDGRQIIREHGTVVDCPTCWGRGWTTIPAAILSEARIGLVSAAMTFAGWAFVCVLILFAATRPAGS